MKNLLTLFVIIILYNIGYSQINQYWEDNSWMGNWNLGQEWEVGVPMSGPLNGVGGLNCVATNLLGNYPDELESILISPFFEVPPMSENPFLRFRQWYSFSHGDSATVLIRTQGGGWEPIADPFTWSSSDAWSSPLIDLSSYAGQTVQIGFDFHAVDVNINGNSDVSSGWYIDDVELVTGPIVFNSPENFENGIGHWSGEGAWELGEPTSGPNESHSLLNCFATNLEGNYEDPPVDAVNRLTSPIFEVPPMSENPFLRFRQWYSFSHGDSATVLIRTQGGGWEPIADPFTWSSSDAWSSPLIDLSSYAGQTVQIGFDFHAVDVNINGNSDVSSGWYIDDVELVTGPIVFNSPENFENGIGHWSGEGAWELGEPTSGPNESHSLLNCFATNLEGNYEDFPIQTKNLLTSPLLEVSDTATNPRIRFWHWYDFDDGDYGEVLLKIQGEDWNTVLGPYYSTSDEMWRRPFIDLTPFIGETIQIAFSFHSEDLSINGNSDVSSGWYIDDIEVQYFLTLPPPKITISKSGTTPVPGREVDYFILVENVGESVNDSIKVGELLDPTQVELVSVSPSADAPDSILQNAYFIHWTIPQLFPGEFEVLEYTVKVRDTVPIGTLVTGAVCTWEGVLERLNVCLNALLQAGICAICAAECTPCSGICSLPSTIITVPACLSCLAPCLDCLFIGIQTGGTGGCVQNGYGAIIDCFLSDIGEGGCDVDSSYTEGAIDPNEKLVNAEKFIKIEQTLLYPIHFENIGTVEAIDVFVTDTLSEHLDLSTLEVLTPDGVSLDTINRIIKWELLNRNLQPGETDNVLLSIKPNQGLPSGTEITNRAEIQFDIFDPFLTNQVNNIIDEQKPASKMDSLPAIIFETDFEISWSGTDSIGEIDNYTIFVSVDSGHFEPELIRLTDTSTIYSGEPGKTYSFICIAEDIAGNIEEKLPIAEATTFIDPSVSVLNPDEGEDSKFLKQNYPNPFINSTTIEYSVDKSSHVLLEIFDVFGTRIGTIVNQKQSRNEYKITINKTLKNGYQMSSGIYFYKLLIDNKMEIKKMILIE